MWRKIRAAFAWRMVFECGVWRYDENRITAARRVVRVCSYGYSPLDQDWLDGKPSQFLIPPVGGSAIVRGVTK